MSVLIKDMGKPKSCYAVIDGEFEYCPFVNTDDDCVLLLKKGTCEGTWEDQYSKCPLIEAPELCEDVVSRQAAIDILSLGKEILNRVLDDMDVVGTDREKYSWGLRLIESNIEDIEELPSAQQERKRGKWIYNSPVTMKCERCGFVIKDWDWNRFKFCPNCTCDMRGEQDENR